MNKNSMVSCRRNFQVEIYKLCSFDYVKHNHSFSKKIDLLIDYSHFHVFHIFYLFQIDYFKCRRITRRKLIFSSC